jgi:hypothetical protein
MKRHVGLFGLASVLLLLASALCAQEPPPPELVPAPSGTATPADATPADATPAPAKVILLPIEFSVYEKGLGTGEIVADWTEAARTNLAAAATDVLGERAGLQLVPMPPLEPAEQEVLREHLALVKLVVLQANSMMGGAWNSRKPDFDRRFGDGLQFLRAKSGADFAIMIDGSQVKQSGGSIFSQVALAAIGVGIPGGGTYLSSSLIDLQGGEVKWFNARFGVEALGITGSDIRNPGEAQATLRKLFEPYPEIPALTVK